MSQPLGVDLWGLRDEADASAARDGQF
jgi:hypothetical protein